MLDLYDQYVGGEKRRLEKIKEVRTNFFVGVEEFANKKIC